jgi:hypothetical protein
LLRTENNNSSAYTYNKISNAKELLFSAFNFLITPQYKIGQNGVISTHPAQEDNTKYILSFCHLYI